MVGMHAMILTKKLKNLIFILLFLSVGSCETLNEIAGLTKSDIDDSLYSETPELILPPDFDKNPRPKPQTKNVNNQDPALRSYQGVVGYQTVNPRITNYLSPRINIESSPSPSDSIEKFKQGKRFTIGQWVYSQYVNGFKRGNLYYRPVYDKGYNFSRRYVPDRNVASFQTPQVIRSFEPPSPPINYESGLIPNEGSFDSLDQIPVLD